MNFVYNISVHDFKMSACIDLLLFLLILKKRPDKFFNQ